jgi:uncharacterized protein YbjT (DUF2867 family)
MGAATDAKILISGATGNVGGELAKALSRMGVRFRAMVRSPGRVPALVSLPGIKLVNGDFDNRDTLAGALQGVERAFLATASSERAEAQQRAFVDAARQEGVRHLVKLSQWAAVPNSPVRFLRSHAAGEAAIRDSGMAYTFLRPNLFMQALLGSRPTISAKGQFYAAAGNAKISVIDVRDIAAVAAAALVEQGHEGKVHDLTGPAALTHAEMAAQLASALGRAVAFVDVPPDVMRAALLGAGFPEWQADGVVEDYAHYRRGEASAITSGVKDATGMSPRTFAEFARDYAPAFR